MKLAVYGTLKQGYRLHHYLGKSVFLKRIVIEGFRLHDLGCPIMVRSPNDKVHAELYDLDPDPKILKRLDEIESMYNRVELTQGDDTFSVYVYKGRPFGKECNIVHGAYLWG